MDNMNYFFWQNTNSMHQSAFFRALASSGTGQVTLIVTEPLPDSRKAMGWSEPELPGVNVIHLTSVTDHWQDLIEQNNSRDCIHIFSGIAAFKNVQRAFVHAIKYNCRIGIFTEPLDFRGIKGKVRQLRGFYHQFIYSSAIEFVLTTGKTGVAQFRNWGYDKNKIFEWAYTVENSSTLFSTKNANSIQPFKLMFAGSLIHRKGYDILIKALKNIDNDFIADFYCLKKDEIELGKKIESESSLNGKLRLLAFLPNKELRAKMNEYDLFVLPSRHDGWGAVVSESLMEGTCVLVSKFCGSSSIIGNKYSGKVLQNLDVMNLASQINLYLKAGKLTSEQRLKNRDWAQRTISGTAMANYFQEITAHLNNRQLIRPQAPWMKHDAYAASLL